MKQFNKSGKFGRDSSSKYSSRSSGSDYKPKRFNKDDDYESSSNRFRPEGRGEGRGGKLEMHEVTCDECGIKCDVPFKPTSSKPVYCRSCFKKNEANAPLRYDSSRNDDYKPRNPDRDFRPRSREEDFKPRAEKPNNEELEKINKKLDKILKALKIED